MKKIILYLCLIAIVILPGCAASGRSGFKVTHNQSRYQQKNLKKFKHKKRHKKDGSRYHPAVRKDYGTTW